MAGATSQNLFAGILCLIAGARHRRISEIRIP
jgi:hypothetical protein